MLAVSRADLPTLAHLEQPRFLHQPVVALVIDRKAFLLEMSCDARIAINQERKHHLLGGRHQRYLLTLRFAGRSAGSLLLTVVAFPPHVQNRTGLRKR